MRTVSSQKKGAQSFFLRSGLAGGRLRRYLEGFKGMGKLICSPNIGSKQRLRGKLSRIFWKTVDAVRARFPTWGTPNVTLSNAFLLFDSRSVVNRGSAKGAKSLKDWWRKIFRSSFDFISQSSATQLFNGVLQAISPQLMDLFNLFYGQFTQKSTKTAVMKWQWMFAELCYSV